MKNAIRIIDLNPSGSVVADYTLDLPEPTPDTGELIYIRPDWPPIGDPKFAVKLRAWYAANARLVESA